MITSYIIVSSKTKREVKRDSFDDAMTCLMKFINSGLLGTYKLYSIDTAGERVLVRSYSTSNLPIGVTI